MRIVVICSLVILMSVVFGPSCFCMPGNSRDSELQNSYYALYESTPANNAARYEYLEKYLELRDSSAYEIKDAELAFELGNYYAGKLYLFSKAVKWMEMSSSIYDSYGDEAKAARVNYSTAICYYRISQFHKSLEYCTIASEYFTREKDSLDLVKSYNLLGSIYLVCNDTLSSKEYYFKSLNLSKKMKDSVTTSTALINLVLTSSGADSSEMHDLTEKAVSYCMSMNDTSKICMAYLNAAVAFASNKMFSDSFGYLEKAAPYVRDIYESGRYYLIKANIYEAEGKYDDAEDCLRTAVGYYSRGELNMELLNCYDTWHRLYAYRGDYEHAYNSFKEYFELFRKSDNKDVFIKLYEKMNEIRIMDEKERMSRRQTVYILCSVAIVFVGIYLVLLSIVISRKRSLKLKLQEAEIQKQEAINREKEKELVSQSEMIEIKRMQQYQATQMEGEMMKRIKELDVDDKVKAEINSMCRDLAGASDNAMWKEINSYVPEFNKLFQSRLLEDYPNLTPNEMRLLALLNLNLSTKEISAITRQSPNTIKVSRYRLRAKLNLNNSDTTIQEFLQKYISGR